MTKYNKTINKNTINNKTINKNTINNNTISNKSKSNISQANKTAAPATPSMALNAAASLAATLILSLLASTSAHAQYNPNIAYNPTGNPSFNPGYNPNFANDQASKGFQDQATQQNQQYHQQAQQTYQAQTYQGQNYQNQGQQSQNQANNSAAYNPAPASAFAQTGYSNDGTLMMGGQKIGNPHQILHDAEVPAFMTITANRYTYSNDPTYGQGTLAQMETATTTGSGSDLLLNRLYLSPNNPYAGQAAGAFPNLQTYAGVIRAAQASNYLPTAANDGKIYVFKTLTSASTQAQNILIKELPNTSTFKAAADPKGGGVGVRVTQNGDAAALQNYLATVKPYDFSWQSAFGPYAAIANMANHNNTVVFGANGNMNGINPYVDPASFYFNWVMGSSQVQGFQAQLKNETSQSGKESFGQLVWDSNTNQYAMLRDPNAIGTHNSVKGTIPSFGDGQTGVFGMHTHPDGSKPSSQDLKQANSLGTDQVVIGPNGVNYVVLPGGQGPGIGEFLFEGRYVTIQTAAAIGNNTRGTGREYGAGVYVIVDSQTGEIVGKGVIGNVGLTSGVSLGPPSLMGVAQVTTSDSPDAPSKNGTYSSVTISTPLGTITGQIDHKTGEFALGFGTAGAGVTTGTGYTTSSGSGYRSENGDSNHAPGTSWGSHVNGFT